MTQPVKARDLRDDHDLIAMALCAGVAEWIPFGDGRGALAIEGYGSSDTHVDETGICPVLIDEIRAAIQRALDAI